MRASAFPLDELADLAEQAFADYAYGPLAGGAAALARRCAVESLDLHLSPVARLEARPVGIALLGRRAGVLRVGLMGVLPEARRCGVASALLA
ncbi:MAG TPA: GNAT family N-acetyltransferase, partial [Planctomycetota bacterium]|nr:GNAT family N-acetyltransferase [Planctomycetota bacterium]